MWPETSGTHILICHSLKTLFLFKVYVTSVLSFLECDQDYIADEIGVLSPYQLQVNELYAGEVKL